MTQFHRLCILILTAALLGCAPTFSDGHVKSLAAISAILLEHPEGEIPESSWPEAVINLRPKRVYRTHEGIYICTYEFFVEERGVFVLDPKSSFTPSGAGDPSYDVVAAGVFTYRIAG